MRKLNKSIIDKQSYPEKVLQFGEGNFMRAFVDWQIDIMNQKTNFNGSVVVVQPRGYEKVEKLNEQDGLFTLYLQGIKDGRAVKEFSVIQSISRGINLFSHYDEFIQLAQNPELRFIFSNTTEAGITFNDTDQLEDRPQKSFPAKLTAFLYYRYHSFHGDSDKGCIVIPCELIEKSGEILKDLVLRYADFWNLEGEFGEWVLKSNTFCSSLVDRIVPGYPKDNIDEITEELGFQDDFVVIGEPYHLWVIEGPKWIEQEFPASIGGLNTVITDDLSLYRTRKVRILNGAHTAMTPVAYLYGMNTVAKSIEHDVVGRFVKELIDEEIIPTLDLPVKELQSYAKSIIERFENPYIQHFLHSISLNSMSKFKTRNLPTLLEYKERQQKLPRKLVFSLSALISFYKGKRGNEVIQLSDDPEVLQLFKDEWSTYDGSIESIRKIVSSVLGYETLWEMDLNIVSGLTDAVSNYLFEIEQIGIKDAIKTVIGEIRSKRVT